MGQTLSEQPGSGFQFAQNPKAWDSSLLNTQRSGVLVCSIPQGLSNDVRNEQDCGVVCYLMDRLPLGGFALLGGRATVPSEPAGACLLVDVTAMVAIVSAAVWSSSSSSLPSPGQDEPPLPKTKSMVHEFIR
eukprot:5443502-Pyramimonas_sp.AAC.1